MLEKKELSSLLIQIISVKLLLSYPRKIILNSANAAWLQILINTLAALFLFWVTMRIYERKRNIIELADLKMGKAGKIIVGVLVFIVLFANFISVMRIFPESVKITLLRDIDTKIIIGIFGAAIFIGAMLGISAIAKISYIFLPIAGVIMACFLLLLIPNYKLDNLMPFLGNGAFSIFAKGFHTVSIFSDILILNILISHSKSLEVVRKSGINAILISGIIGIIIVSAYSMIYPYPVSGEFIMPVYQMTRIVHFGEYFNRFEAFFEFVWAILVLLYGSAYLFVMCYVWQTTFNIKHLRPVLAPVILLVVACALIPDSLIDAIKLSHASEFFIYPIAFLLPAVIVLIKREKALEE